MVSVVKRALRIAGEDPHRAYDAMQAEGLEVAELAGDADDQEWLCMGCGRDFPSLHSLAAHRKQVHAKRLPLRRKLPSAVCPGSNVQFFLRDRTLAHLRNSMACAAVVEQLPDLPEDRIAELDAEARQLIRANQRQGLHRLAGPPCRPAGRLSEA